MESLEFIIEGKTYFITSLEEFLDDEFIKLISSYLSVGVSNWSKFKRLSLEFFNDIFCEKDRRESLDYQKAYLNNFTPIWMSFINKKNYGEAEILWNKVLDFITEWEINNPDRLFHKGSPFYYWGVTAILENDMDKGYALMHRALQEDIRTMGSEYPQTPALWFVTANPEKVNQLFREWPLRQNEFLNERIKTYKYGNGKKLEIKDFREKFLYSRENSEIVYFFAYTISRLYQIEKTPPIVYQSAFACQLFFDILFNIVGVINSAISAKSQKNRGFLEQIVYLSNAANINKKEEDWKEINKSFVKDFDKTMEEIIMGNYQYDNGKILFGLEVDLAIAYGIRNRGAHNITQHSVIHDKFEVIERMLFNVLFFVVETLY